MVRITMIVVAIIAIFALSACGGTPAPVAPPAVTISPPAAQSAPTTAPLSSETQLTQKDSGKMVQLNPNGTLQIELDQNGSTGYAWQLLSNNDAILRLVSDKITSGGAVPGAPGKETIKFQAVGSGLSGVRLGYKLWTDEKADPAQKFELSVIVGGTPTLPTPRPTQAGAPKPLETLTKLTLKDSGKEIFVPMGGSFQVDFDLDAKTPGEWKVMANNWTGGVQLASIGIVYPGGTPAVTVPRQTFTFKGVGSTVGTVRLGFKDWTNETAQPNPVFEVIAVVGMPSSLPSATASVPGLTEKDNGKTLDLPKGATFQVTLQGNPASTGYMWALESGNDAVLKPAGDYTFKSSSNLPGAGGKFEFKFTAASAGTATLKFANKRPWELNDPAAPVFTVTINVK